MKQIKSLISIDVESNGLPEENVLTNPNSIGLPYAVAMIVYRNGKPVEKLCLSCLIEGDLDTWLKDNPHLITIENSELVSYETMLEKAAEFYKYYSCRDEDGLVRTKWGYTDYNYTPVLFHCGMTVEGGFFALLKQKGLLGKFEAPMCPIDVADYLRMIGRDPSSVDKYLEDEDITKPIGEVHNPLYDAEVAASAYFHIIDNYTLTR